MPTKSMPMRDVVAQAIKGDNKASLVMNVFEMDEPLALADEIISKLDRLGHEFQEYCYARGGVEYLAVDPKELWQGFLLVCEHGGPFNASPTDGCYDMDQEPCGLCAGKCGRNL